MEIKPNATIITFLTIFDNTKENIIFLFLKQVEELAPTEIYWYPNKGRFGNANYLWVAKRLRQWLAIGENKGIEASLHQAITIRDRISK